MEQIGTKVISTELIDVFSASEGSINLYYGLIGNGKTYAATSDILDLLAQGKVVYCNWHIKVPDFNDQTNLIIIIVNLLLFRKRYYYIPCEKNLHYFDTDDQTTWHIGDKYFDNYPEFLASLNDCHIFFDEGQDIFDSYEGTKFSKLKRKLILHTRHYHRTLNIITQRPTAIQVSARGNVNRFYKCEKIASWPWVRFARSEYQEMRNETVADSPDDEPISVKTYWASKRIFDAYNTDYLAQGIPKSQQVYFEAHDLNFTERCKLLISYFRK